MSNEEIEKLRYPIGKFSPKESYTQQEIQQALLLIEALPANIQHLVGNLPEKVLETPYRPQGWTVRQTIHHLADSHINAYIRFKLAATTETPSINAYPEQLWAELIDGKTADVAVSLQLLKALHLRWVLFLRSLPAAAWQKGYFHPEKKRIVKLDEAVHNYAWHGEHHKAHIANMLK
jgi:hypothetical protein